MFFCVEHLHRLPEEIEIPYSALRRGMIAWSVIRERQEREMKRHGDGH